MQVAAEYFDRFRLRRFAQLHQQLAADVRVRSDAPRPLADIGEPLVRRTAAVFDAEMCRDHGGARMRHGGFERFTQTQADRQHFQSLAAEQREGAMRRDGADCFRIIVVVAKLFRLGSFFSFGDFGGNDALLPHARAQFGEQLRRLGKTLDQNIARAVQRRFHVRHAVFGRRFVIDVLRRFFLWIERGIGKQRIGQRLQPGFARDLRARAPLGFIGQVNIFQRLLRRRRIDGDAQFVGELPLLFDRRQDHRAPLLQLAQVKQSLFEIAQLRVVEIAGNFLAIARNERHRRAFVEQRHR